MKILAVFGTRPEAIKLAPVILELRKVFDVSVCVTAQHREMLDQVLNIFDIKPDYDLDIMKSSQDLFDITSNTLQGLKAVLSEVMPDIVLVHGDTSTTMATSLSAYYLKIPVAHVEAGLRTNDIYSPFPEEINRQLTGRIARYHFTPTESSRQNLLNEGVNNSQIFVTGNTVIDSLMWVANRSDTTSFNKSLIKDLPFLITKENCKIILVTAHRRENFGQGLEEICNALCNIAITHPELRIVYPVHLNPNVQQPVKHMLSEIDNIYLINPLEYVTFVKLMKLSYLILTDSGGIQEEAPSIDKPVLLMRNTTERPEVVEGGAVKLVEVDRYKIAQAVKLLLTDEASYKAMTQACNPYGDGNASERIRKTLEEKII